MIRFFVQIIRRCWKNQFLRFLFIGGINTLFGYGIFAVFIFFKFHYSLAVLFSTIIGVLFNFKTLGVFVFKSHDNRKIIGFVMVYVVTYFINVGLMYCLTKIGISAYFAGMIAVFPVAITGFVLNKLFVFSFKAAD